MDGLNRRRFLEETLTTASVAGLAGTAKQAVGASEGALTGAVGEGEIIDTNVNLFRWPFRRLRYETTPALVSKLQNHGIREAWAGSYEALFHKDIASVNERLAREVEENGQGMLIPFGTVNPAFPDWREDLRRCQEEYDMPGIRVYPGYQGFDLDGEAFRNLVQATAERNMLLQIAIDMEDERIQLPLVPVPAANASPLPEILSETPNAHIMLVNAFRHVRGDIFDALARETDVMFDISRLDGTGGITRLLEGNHWYIGDEPISADRLAFGSHFPFFPLENVLYKFMDSPLTEDQAAAILFENANRLMDSL